MPRPPVGTTGRKRCCFARRRGHFSAGRHQFGQPKECSGGRRQSASWAGTSTPSKTDLRLRIHNLVAGHPKNNAQERKQRADVVSPTAFGVKPAVATCSAEGAVMTRTRLRNHSRLHPFAYQVCM